MKNGQKLPRLNVSVAGFSTLYVYVTPCAYSPNLLSQPAPLVGISIAAPPSIETVALSEYWQAPMLNFTGPSTGTVIVTLL